MIFPSTVCNNEPTVAMDKSAPFNGQSICTQQLLEIGESPQGFTMELRNHPIMICDGVKTWPPKWFQTYGSTNRVVVGEVGFLDTVFLSKLIPPRQVYLVMTTAEDNCYLGSLMFEQADAAEEVFHFLLAHLKQPINQIGSINLPDRSSWKIWCVSASVCWT